jgi:hypothetical protein
MKPQRVTEATDTRRGSTTSVPRLRCEGCRTDVVPYIYRRGPHLRANCGHSVVPI